MSRKILLILPYPPGHAPSQRFRIEHFIPILEEEGWEVTIAPFLDEATWKIYHRPGKQIQKLWGLAKGFGRRYRMLFGVRQFDRVWVHRECAPLGLPLIAWYLKKVANQQYLFEFDDAIWLPNVSAGNRKWSFIKPYGNAKKLMKWSGMNVAGNDWLKANAEQLNPKSSTLPTIVDTEQNHRFTQDQQTEKPNIGWTGSHSTLPYLQAHLPILQKVYEQHPFKLVVISDIQPTFDFPDLEFIEWSSATEGEDLLKFHIGIMPLPDETWVNGKCGFKLIQYMSEGIVPVADRLGVNAQVIDHKKNGFLCSNEEEWTNALLRLLRDHDLRSNMAQGCRPWIEERYSVASQRELFLHLLD
ncbi:MAG: glycosyltransferase [Flavobacteriales bacterium]|nr:glycosyltransferase [Flavobacteriales bacterium]